MVTLSNDHEGGSDGTTLSGHFSFGEEPVVHGRLSAAVCADMYFAALPQWEHYDRSECDRGPEVPLGEWCLVTLTCGHGSPVRPRMAGGPFG